MDTHNATVVDQFTRQADAFAAAAAIRDDQALDLLVTRCGAGANDESLDVACGPGLVVCAFARVVRAAAGIDLTPAMISKGEALAAAEGLANTSFRVGDVNALPYACHRFRWSPRVTRSITSRSRHACSGRWSGSAARMAESR